MTEQRNETRNEKEKRTVRLEELKQQIEALGEEEFMMPVELGGDTNAKQ